MNNEDISKVEKQDATQFSIGVYLAIHKWIKYIPNEIEPISFMIFPKNVLCLRYKSSVFFENSIRIIPQEYKKVLIHIFSSNIEERIPHKINITAYEQLYSLAEPLRYIPNEK